MGAATAERKAPAASEIDPDALAEAAKDIADNGDDGLGQPPTPTAPTPADLADPNSEHNTGVPGGRQPGDDGYVNADESEIEAAADEVKANGEDLPPTPPAQLPDDGGDEDEVEVPQLFLTGERAIGVKVGGRKPDSSVLKLKGGKIDLQGQFDRGDRLIAVATLQVTGDNDQDTIEKASGVVKSTSKVQHATLCGFARVEEWLADKLGDDPQFLDDVLNRLDLVAAPEGE